MDEILNVDAVIVTHTHPDHWDETAKALVPKYLPIFTQNEQDRELILSQGFSDVRLCGVVFRHPDEKTLYLAGDTIWNQYVQDSLQQFQPEVVILNAGDAQVIGLGSIIMGKQDVYEIFLAAPQATLIATHMESVNHAVLTRKELREFSVQKGMTDRLLIFLALQVSSSRRKRISMLLKVSVLRSRLCLPRGIRLRLTCCSMGCKPECLMGLSRKGLEVRFSLMMLLTIADGKIIEKRAHFDRMDIRKQLFATA